MSVIDPQEWQLHAWRNRFQSLLLLVVMFGFAGLLGMLLFGLEGLTIVLFLIVIAFLIPISISPRLTMKMYRAERLTPESSPRLFHYITELSQRAGLNSRPELYYIPSQVVNAFAIGTQSQSVIGITDGILRRLNERELVGVLAHEVSHIRSNDIHVMGIADFFSRVTRFLSLLGQILLFLNLPLIFYVGHSINWWFILLLVFAPNISALAQLALSRTREFDADLHAAKLTGDPVGLAQALQKIEAVEGQWYERILRPEWRIPDPSLLRTHPPTQERIERLLSLKSRNPNIYLRPAELPYSGYLEPQRQMIQRRPKRHFNGLWY